MALNMLVLNMSYSEMIGIDKVFGHVFALGKCAGSSGAVGSPGWKHSFGGGSMPRGGTMSRPVAKTRMVLSMASPSSTEK
jgi:hypothetical protein